MARLVKRLVKNVLYAYLEEDVYYGSKRSVLSIYLGPFEEFSSYDVNCTEAKTKLLAKLLENCSSGTKLYKSQYLSESGLLYLEYVRVILRQFNLTNSIDEIKSYSDAFYTRYAQGTTAIEGNTCTLRETDLILNEGVSVGGKDLREIHEIENYKKLRSYVDSYSGDLTEEFILKINSIILDNLDVPKGSYRKVAVVIRGADFEPPPAAVVPDEMVSLLSWYKKVDLHPLETAVLFHQKFEEIHPFAEGNGRTGREILNFILRKNGFPPIFFGTPEREEYLSALDSGNKENFIPLFKFILWRVLEAGKSYKKHVTIDIEGFDSRKISAIGVKDN